MADLVRKISSRIHKNCAAARNARKSAFGARNGSFTHSLDADGTGSVVPTAFSTGLLLMNRHPKEQRKTYAMQRMSAAIGRAMRSESAQEQERARRWAAAWGVVSGIRSSGVRLRRSVLADRRGKGGQRRA